MTRSTFSASFVTNMKEGRKLPEGNGILNILQRMHLAMYDGIRYGDESLETQAPSAITNVEDLLVAALRASQKMTQHGIGPGTLEYDTLMTILQRCCGTIDDVCQQNSNESIP